MKKGLIILGIIVVIVIIIGGWLTGFYNNVIKQEQAIVGQWAQVENQYQRRFDLIPNLVESVKGSLTQEQKVFGDLADARTRYAGATTVSDKVEAANMVESALGRLLVIMENYPQLRSVEAISTLMTQLEGTENRVSVERMRFNEVTQTYNAYIKQFPGNILAGFFGFSEKPYFQAAPAAETAPAVNLNVNQ